MKSFFYNVSFVAKFGENVQKTTAWGTAKFDTSIPLEYQIRRELDGRGITSLALGSINITAFTPLELDSSNHTEKLIELWRIERTAGEYYGGKNTGVYINEELAKLGIHL